MPPPALVSTPEAGCRSSLNPGRCLTRIEQARSFFLLVAAQASPLSNSISDEMSSPLRPPRSLLPFSVPRCSIRHLLQSERKIPSPSPGFACHPDLAYSRSRRARFPLPIKGCSFTKADFFRRSSSRATELGGVRALAVEHEALQVLSQVHVAAEMKLDLTWRDLVWFGVGAGIFVLTGQEARDDFGPAVIISSGVSAMLFVFCYTEFAVEIPFTGLK